MIQNSNPACSHPCRVGRDGLVEPKRSKPLKLKRLFHPLSILIWTTTKCPKTWPVST